MRLSFCISFPERNSRTSMESEKKILALIASPSMISSVNTFAIAITMRWSANLPTNSGKFAWSLRRLLNEFLVLHLLGRHQPRQRIAEQERILALIEAPLKFLKVAIQVFCAHLMVRANDRPLEQRPYALDAVRVNITPHPFLRAVVNTVMLCVRVLDPEVSGVVVRVDFGRIGLC